MQSKPKPKAVKPKPKAAKPKTAKPKPKPKAAKPKAAKPKAAKPKAAKPKPKSKAATPKAATPKPAAAQGKRTPATKHKGRPASAKPTLLSGGNPQIAKGDGDAPVQAFIAAMPGWQHEVGRRLDALIVRTVPSAQKAVKWNSPFYGVEGKGWFLNFHCFTKYVKVAFFRGASLRPVPPGASAHKDVRYLDIRENDKLDEKLVVSWIQQASKLPGWVP